tara:strand:+ start:345 stop:1019 length:675 start_codon:yes stop_codon:yes gene_type:complete
MASINPEPSTVYEGVSVFKTLLNSFIKLMPIGLYFFTYFSLIIFKDLRAGVLLLGLVLNELFGYAYVKYSNTVKNKECVLFGNDEMDKAFGFINNTHIEIICFVAAFFVSDMWYKEQMNWFMFNFLLAMIIITIWSRMSVGCLNDLTSVIFNVLFGFILGGLFYYFFSDTYSASERGQLERETCDLGYSDYKCETIKDGTVIVKHPYKNEAADEDDNEDDSAEN